jgi:hypothetical protein
LPSSGRGSRYYAVRDMHYAIRIYRKKGKSESSAGTCRRIPIFPLILLQLELKGTVII